MNEQDAKRYQYLKQWLEHGEFFINGGCLNTLNIKEWDTIIDDHLERLETNGKFKKGQNVYVCTLNPEQALWIKQSASLKGEILDSWLDKRSQDIIYKIKYEHNNAIFEANEKHLLHLNSFDGVESPVWVDYSREVVGNIKINAKALIEPNELLYKLTNILKLEKSTSHGEVQVSFQHYTPFIDLKIFLNKKTTFFLNGSRISKIQLLEKLSASYTTDE